MCRKEQSYNISDKLTVNTFELQVQPFSVQKNKFGTGMYLCAFVLRMNEAELIASSEVILQHIMHNWTVSFSAVTYQILFYSHYGSLSVLMRIAFQSGL